MRGGGGDWVPNQWTTRKGRSSARVLFIDTWHFSGHVRLNPCLKPGNVFSSFFKDFGNLQKLRWDILCILMMHSIGSHCLSVWLQQRTLEWRLTLNRQNLLLHWRCDGFASSSLRFTNTCLPAKPQSEQPPAVVCGQLRNLKPNKGASLPSVVPLGGPHLPLIPSDFFA